MAVDHLHTPAEIVETPAQIIKNDLRSFQEKSFEPLLFLQNSEGRALDAALRETAQTMGELSFLDRRHYKENGLLGQIDGDLAGKVLLFLDALKTYNGQKHVSLDREMVQSFCEDWPKFKKEVEQILASV